MELWRAKRNSLRNMGKLDSLFLWEDNGCSSSSSSSEEDGTREMWLKDSKEFFYEEIWWWTGSILHEYIYLPHFCFFFLFSFFFFFGFWTYITSTTSTLTNNNPSTLTIFSYIPKPPQMYNSHTYTITPSYHRTGEKEAEQITRPNRYRIWLQKTIWRTL